MTAEIETAAATDTRTGNGSQESGARQQFKMRQHHSDGPVGINSDQISRHSLLRRILPNALLCKLDYIWSHSKNKDNKFWGRTQVIVAQRFH